MFGNKMVDRSKYTQPTTEYSSTSKSKKKKDEEASYQTEEEEEGKECLFITTEIRHKFMRKVYFTLTIQLGVTIGIMCLIKFCPNDYACQWFARINYFIYIMMGIGAGLMITISCCGKVRHIFPVNLILLGLFTIVQGIILGCIICRYKIDMVMMAVGITAAITVALSIFAIQTRCDFTVFRGIMLVLVIVLMGLGILLIFIRDKILQIIYCSLGVLIFGVYIVIDTQMIMTGKHTYSLTPDEYILGALMLYVDIVNLFIDLLALMGLIDS